MTETSREPDAFNPTWAVHEAELDTQGLSNEIQKPHRVLHQIRDDLVLAWHRMLESRPHEAFELANHVAVQLPALTPETADAYLRALLTHCAASNAPEQHPRRKRAHVSEHLSARERAVLVLIANGQSNKRVAQTLHVTPETIKSHLKRVFVKLGANTRAEAVARAADLGQLVDVTIPPTATRETLFVYKTKAR